MWQGKLNVLGLIEFSSCLCAWASAFLVLIRIYFKDSIQISQHFPVPLSIFMNKLLLETLMHYGHSLVLFFLKK